MIRRTRQKKCDFGNCEMKYFNPIGGKNICCESCNLAPYCPEECRDIDGYCKTRRQTRKLIFAVFYIFLAVMLALMAYVVYGHPFDALAAVPSAPAYSAAESFHADATPGTAHKNKKSAPSKKQIKKTITMKGTWYTGDEGGTTGAGGKLISGKTLAINNSQRKALGLRYGDKVYIKAAKKYKLTGYWTVKDTGCRSGIADLYYRHASDIPAAFRCAGVVSVKVIVYK